MKRKLLLLACFIVSATALNWNLYAQDSAAVPIKFFQNPRPSLLFHTSDLRLTAYEGGIGVGLQQTENLYWRLSLGFSFSRSDFERDYPEGSFDKYSSSVYTEYSIGAAAAPMFMLHQSDPGFVFTSPFLKVDFLKNTSETTWIDSVGEHSYNSSKHSIKVQAGCGIGAGISITSRIMIAAEYRASIEYSDGEDRRSDSPHYIYLRKSKSNAWRLSSNAMITLFYKL